MRRYHRPVLALVALLMFVVSFPLAGQEAGEQAEKKWGMFVRLRASGLKVGNQALLLGVRDEPGIPFAGDVLDADWGYKIAPEIQFGFILPNGRDQFRVRFFQFDETLNIGQNGPFANTWASALAGVDEDLDGDGTVNGFDCTGTGFAPGSTTIPCESDGQFEPILDGAEDLNFNGQRDFIRFTHSDTIAAEIQTEVLTFDIDYARPLKRTPRFTLEGSAGLRYVNLSQDMKMIYSDYGAFAAYQDSKDDSFYIGAGGAPLPYDADGDGLLPIIGGTSCSRDCMGDGWGDGNRRRQVGDDLIHVPTVDQDIIEAKVETRGGGLTLGLRGEYLFRGKRLEETTTAGFKRSWALETTVNLGLMYGDTTYSLTEVFVDERDAFPNFIDWDLNDDGFYGDGPKGHDFDCNGDTKVDFQDWLGPCNEEVYGPGKSLNGWSLTGAAPGLIDSVFPVGEGYPDNPFDDQTLDQGDPIPESERNTTIVQTTQTLRDLSGDNSGQFFASLDIDLGVRWYFSRFADISFGARASRWFDVGNLKAVHSDTSADRLADGDLTLQGFFVTLTVRPKF